MANSDLLTLSIDEMKARLAQSPEAAAELLQAHAEAGMTEAQLLYGQVLLDGKGVAADPVTGFGWFTRAAHSGDLMAINMVGRCHDRGWGTPVDKVEAARWFRRAAEGGLDWGMYNYGSALGVGAGVEKDERTALTWFVKAAELGHAKSINFLGVFYEEGEIVPRDMARAAECFRIAAEAGDFRGQYNHARILAGRGEIEVAVRWIEAADETCTPAFRVMMRDALEQSAIPAIREAATKLR